MLRSLNIRATGSPYSVLVSSNKMEASFRSIAGWILASLLIFASLQRSEAITFPTKPENPYLVVVGVNNTDRELIWEYTPEAGEDVQSILFRRNKLGESNTVDLASRLLSTGFTVFEPYKNDYDAKLNNKLTIKRVTNDQEYEYSILINYNENSVPKTETNKVHVDVKVPPKLIEPVPPRQSMVDIGKNLTLTCNASGDPLLEPKDILWTKEGVAAKDYNVSGYRLYLVDVKRTDVGSYKCTANNGYGTATSLTVVSVKCSINTCQAAKTVGITINDQQWPWKTAYGNRDSIEYKMLQSNLTSAIASVYTKNPGKQLYEQAITELRSGSIVAHVQLLFGSGVNDPLQPLRDEVAKKKLGPFDVNEELVVDPTFPPSTTPTEETTTGLQATPDAGARTNSGLTDAQMWGIIGGCIAFLLLIVIVILIVCCCCKDRCCRGGATKSKSYSEADGYRMNKQPPSSGLGTASPAYVEARMYAPANASRRQDDQQTPIHYTEPSFDKSSGKPPPPRYDSGTEYSEMSPEKRPPPAGGGGQGEGGFELWC